MSYFAGPHSALGILTTAFIRSKHQPENDLRLYLQFVIVASLLNDEDKTSVKCLNLKLDVSIPFFP